MLYRRLERHSVCQCLYSHQARGGRLQQTCALDHAAENIRINGVAPGVIRTEIIAKQISDEDENIDLKALETMHPMNRMGNPHEPANAIVWLLSDEASFTTGHILSVDGGFQAK